MDEWAMANPKKTTEKKAHIEHTEKYEEKQILRTDKNKAK